MHHPRPTIAAAALALTCLAGPALTPAHAQSSETTDDATTAGNPFTTQTNGITARLTNLIEYRSAQPHNNSYLAATLTLGGELPEGTRILRTRVLTAAADDVTLTRRDDNAATAVSVDDNTNHVTTQLQLNAAPRSAETIELLELAVYLTEVTPESGNVFVTPPIGEIDVDTPFLEKPLDERGVRVRFDRNGRDGNTLRLLIQDPQGYLLDLDYVDADDNVYRPQSIHKHPRNSSDGDTALWFVFPDQRQRNGRGDTPDLLDCRLRLYVADPDAVRDVTFAFENVPLP